LLDFGLNGRAGQRMGNRSDRYAPHGVFPSRGDDRWIAIACTDDEMWTRLADVLDLTAARWSRLEDRLRDVDEIEQCVAGYTAERSADEAADLLQARGVEAVPVADLLDAATDPSLLSRRHFVDLEHLCMGPSTYERNGFRMADASGGYDSPSPLLGQHTDDVLSTVLGLTEAELSRLREDGALD